MCPHSIYRKATLPVSVDLDVCVRKVSNYAYHT